MDMCWLAESCAYGKVDEGGNKQPDFYFKKIILASRV